MLRSAARPPGAPARPSVRAAARAAASSGAAPPKKVAMVSLGCPKNTVDGEWYALLCVGCERRRACAQRPTAACQKTTRAGSPQPASLHAPHDTATRPRWCIAVCQPRLALIAGWEAAGCTLANRRFSFTLPSHAWLRSFLSPGEVLLGDLSSAGFDLIDDPADADAIVVNTCAFVEDAKSESLEAILEASSLRGANGKKKKVVVTGCLAQRYGADLAASLPEADLVVGFQHYGGLAASLGDVLAGRPPPKDQRVRVGDATVPFRPEARRARLTPKHTAYLRVAEGCSHACTFCAIPGFR